MDKKEFNKAEIFQLIDTIKYSNEAIVSKTVLNKETGTVTLFAFDKGQGLSEHTAPFDAMVSIIEGKGRIIINNEKYDLNKGESIIMPANIPHAVEAIDKFKMLLVMIKS
ncbi:cupin domain-containing protein [Bacteroidota bacterium]